MAKHPAKGEEHRAAAGKSIRRAQAPKMRGGAVHRPAKQRAGGCALPHLLQEIADVTDVDTALAVARAKGGQHAGFTQKPRPDNWLARAVGLDKAAVIGHALVGATGARLLVPMGPEALNTRRAKIEALTLEGRSTADVARATGVCTRTVTYHRARMRAEGVLRDG